jgi:hypothetical protein
MPKQEYVLSKEIEANPNYPNLRHLTLVRDSDTKEYFLLLAETERPAMIDPEAQMVSEERTKDRLAAKRNFFEINSFADFMNLKKEEAPKK